MAILTYDNATSQPGDELTADEQESLRVGEELASQEQELLAGKFTNAEELAKAYKELEGKLGSRGTESEDEDVSDESGESGTEEGDSGSEEGDEEELDTSFLDRLYEEAINDSADFSDEILAELENYDKEDIAQMFLEYRNNQGDADSDEPVELDAEDQEAILDAVGGAEVYEQMMRWAGESLSEQEIEMYDTVMSRGDPLAAYFAAQALNYRYTDANGKEGEMVTGRAPSTKAAGFRSQQELVSAMNDPRYDSDPAYREDVMRKLERSPELNF